MDISGTAVRPLTPLPPLMEGIKTLDDLFSRMRENSTFGSFRDMSFVATGVELETKPLTEADMEEPAPMSKEMDSMPVQPRFDGLFKFKSETHQTAYSNPRTTLSAPEGRSQ